MSERERMARQTQLDGEKSAEQRNRDGQFATPYALALDIVEFLKRKWPTRRAIEFLEPCVGTGAFYSALTSVFPKVERAVGIEKDAAFARAAADLWAAHGLQVIRGDFTRLSPPAKRFNLLVTNPPYSRHHHLDTEGKARLQKAVAEKTGLRLSGLAGLYCHFLLLADDWLARGGLSAWLIPGEFLDVNYGTAVKEYLTRNVHLLHIHRYRAADVQFPDALVSSAVVVFEKAAPGQEPVTFTQGGRLLEPETTVRVERESLEPSRKWNKLFDAPDAELRGAGITFGDLFTIKRGLATGDNGFFILSEDRANELGIPPQFLRPILPPPRRLAVDVVEATAGGMPDLPERYLLLDCPLPAGEVQKRHPRLWEYLRTGLEAKVHEGYLASRRSPWYSQEDRPPAPFLCTYMGRGQKGRRPFRLIWNKSNATAHNVYLMLYPKGELKAAMGSDPTVTAKVFAALRAIDTDSFAGQGRVYGGGLFKMEPRELAAIPADVLVKAAGLKVSRQGGLFDVT